MQLKQNGRAVSSAPAKFCAMSLLLHASTLAVLATLLVPLQVLCLLAIGLGRGNGGCGLGKRGCRHRAEKQRRQKKLHRKSPRLCTPKPARYVSGYEPPVSR